MRRLARGQEKVGDPRRSPAKIHEAGRDLGPYRWPQGRGDLRRQPGGDGRIGKSIPAGLDADRSAAKRLVEELTSGLRVATGGRGELKPIETISDLCDPPENLGQFGGQIDGRVLAGRWPIAIGQLDDLEAGPCPGV